jgi:hypothetical protein
MLRGELKPLVSVKELMHDMIDPIADSIFAVVGDVTSAKGVVERPRRQTRTGRRWRREQQRWPERPGWNVSML